MSGAIPIAVNEALHCYVDEFTFRLNEGNVSRHTLERLESFVLNVAGKRLTYKALIESVRTDRPRYWTKWPISFCGIGQSPKTNAAKKREKAAKKKERERELVPAK